MYQTGIENRNQKELAKLEEVSNLINAEADFIEQNAHPVPYRGTFWDNEYLFTDRKKLSDTTVVQKTKRIISLPTGADTQWSLTLVQSIGTVADNCSAGMPIK